MEGTASTTGAANDTQFVLPDGRRAVVAPLGKRLAAALVDGVLTVAVNFGLLAAFGVKLIAHPPLSGGDLAKRVAIELPSALVLLVAMMALTDGTTPGKRLIGLRVVRSSGERVGAPFALWREVVLKWFVFGLLVSLGGVIGFVGAALGLADVIVLCADSRYRSLHDRFARSCVIVDPLVPGDPPGTGRRRVEV